MCRYDYECSHCGIMEITHSIHDDALTKCPECGGKNFKRLLSLSVAVHKPKDSGWENLNDGKGMYMSGLGRRTDNNAYCRTLHEATEKAKRMNKSYEIA